MKKNENKTFSAVKMMREIRDRMSEELRGMTPREQIEYIEKKSGLRREENKRAATASSNRLQTR